MVEALAWQNRHGLFRGDRTRRRRRIVSWAGDPPWGAVVWLTTVVVDGGDRTDVPGIYGGSLTVVGWNRDAAAYLALAWMAARERPP